MVAVGEGGVTGRSVFHLQPDQCAPHLPLILLCTMMAAALPLSAWALQINLDLRICTTSQESAQKHYPMSECLGKTEV